MSILSGARCARPAGRRSAGSCAAYSSILFLEMTTAVLMVSAMMQGQHKADPSPVARQDLTSGACSTTTAQDVVDEISQDFGNSKNLSFLQADEDALRELARINKQKMEKQIAGNISGCDDVLISYLESSVDLQEFCLAEPESGSAMKKKKKKSEEELNTLEKFIEAQDLDIVTKKSGSGLAKYHVPMTKAFAENVLGCYAGFKSYMEPGIVPRASRRSVSPRSHHQQLEGDREVEDGLYRAGLNTESTSSARTPADGFGFSQKSNDDADGPIAEVGETTTIRRLKSAEDYANFLLDVVQETQKRQRQVDAGAAGEDDVTSQKLKDRRESVAADARAALEFILADGMLKSNTQDKGGERNKALHPRRAKSTRPSRPTTSMSARGSSRAQQEGRSLSLARGRKRPRARSGSPRSRGTSSSQNDVDLPALEHQIHNQAGNSTSMSGAPSTVTPGTSASSTVVTEVEPSKRELRNPFLFVPLQMMRTELEEKVAGVVRGLGEDKTHRRGLVYKVLIESDVTTEKNGAMSGGWADQVRNNVCPSQALLDHSDTADNKKLRPDRLRWAMLVCKSDLWTLVQLYEQNPGLVLRARAVEFLQSGGVDISKMLAVENKEIQFKREFFRSQKELDQLTEILIALLKLMKVLSDDEALVVTSTGSTEHWNIFEEENPAQQEGEATHAALVLGKNNDLAVMLKDFAGSGSESGSTVVMMSQLFTEEPELKMVIGSPVLQATAKRLEEVRASFAFLQHEFRRTLCDGALKDAPATDMLFHTDGSSPPASYIVPEWRLFGNYENGWTVKDPLAGRVMAEKLGLPDEGIPYKQRETEE
ncbi:unnamed protein product [Amoebophrya sp. A120]|nr:unnamed protein product [Amoebophrya sp. A120]|eukprot:GSA120T00013275001.1